jgi:hypothetical protein
MGGLILALTEDPQTTRAWAQGAEGERRVAEALAKCGDDFVHVLNDRRIPPTRNNIDHIAVTPSGVYVIDAKAYTGTVRVRNKGNIFRNDLHLVVGRRDCASAVAGVLWQATKVAAVVHAAAAGNVPVCPVLCFVDAEWPLLAAPTQFQGVRLEGLRSIRRLVGRGGALDAQSAAGIAAAVADAFPSA